jgi:hypothetical protein
MKMKADDFNRAAEDFYREELRQSHTLEGIQHLEEDLQRIASTACNESQTLRGILKSSAAGRDVSEFFLDVRRKVADETASPELLRRLISLLIVTVAFDRRQAERPVSHALSPSRQAANA